MSYNETAKAAHLELSQADWELRKLALAYPEYRRRSSYPLFADPPKVIVFRQQSWPTFIKSSKANELKSISVAVSNLIRSIPERVFGNDPVAICKYYGLRGPEVARAWLSEPRGIAQAITRGDFVMTANGFKCIEFNFWANLGGWETSLLAEMHLKTPLTSNFIKAKQLEVSYTDTVDLMFKHILRDARALVPNLDQPLNIAFGCRPNDPREVVEAMFGGARAAYKKACNETGRSEESRLLACQLGQLALASDGGLMLGGQLVHAVVAFHTANAPAVFRSFKLGKVKLYNGPACLLLNDKRSLAMLSMLGNTDLVDAEERRLIEKAIPWTRTVDVPPALQGSCRALSVEELVDRRDELVLKSAIGSGGDGVHIGKFTPAPEWSSLVRQAVGSPGWVIQELLQSLPFLYQNGDEGCSVHDVVWGPFVFGQTYAGMILRMQPEAAKSPVNLSLTATEGMLFELS